MNPNNGQKDIQKEESWISIVHPPKMSNMKCININGYEKISSAHKNIFYKIMQKDKQFIYVKQLQAVVSSYDIHE